MLLLKIRHLTAQIVAHIVYAIALASVSFAANSHLGPPPPGGDPGKRPAANCTEDPYEPDSMDTPIRIEQGGRYEEMGLCGGNPDFWVFDVSPGTLLTLRVEFSHGQGDIDMTLHRMGSDEVIDVSEGTSDFELLTYSAEEEESLVLNVYGYEGVENSYALVVEIDDYSAQCMQDSLEEGLGDSQSALQASGTARICIGDEDWYTVEMSEGEGFDFSVAYDPEMSPLRITLFSEDGRTPVQESHGNDETGTVVLPHAVTAGRFYVRVDASEEGGYNGYTFSVARYRPGNSVEGTVSGAVLFQDQLRGEDVTIGASFTPWVAAKEITVEVVRELDGRTIAQTTTDSEGAYSMAYIHRAGGEVFTRVSAKLAIESDSVQVVIDEEEMKLHTADSDFLGNLEEVAPGQYTVDFRFNNDDPMSGALNIMDNCLKSISFIRQYSQHETLDLDVIWQRGVPHACTSCYSDGTIYLGGGFDDPDEFDDSVILHEFGHFFVDEMSYDDSPGGSHNGDRTGPLVAYGEGIATAFSMMVEESPIYVDTMLSGGLYQDFETADFEEVIGTSDGSVTGLISEYLIASLIWDMVDLSSESHDPDLADLDAVMEVLLEHMPRAAEDDRGFPGVEFADFLYGYRQMNPEVITQVDRLSEFYQFSLDRTEPVSIPGQNPPK